MTRLLTILAALLTLSACANAPPRPAHTSYGPPTMFPGNGGFRGTSDFSPANGINSSQWGPTDEHFQPATPGPFKGY